MGFVSLPLVDLGEPENSNKLLFNLSNGENVAVLTGLGVYLSSLHLFGYMFKGGALISITLSPNIVDLLGASPKD